MGNPEALAAVFDNQICLIVEPSASFVSAIRACLKGMGLNNTRVVIATKFREAKPVIAELKPRILICEYDLDGENGIGLVEAQQAVVSDPLRIAIIVSKNPSDSAIAEAAEEQVDSFILKPFSSEDFKQRLTEVVIKKIHPSDYTLKLRRGNLLKAANNLVAANNFFQEAKPLNSKPSLACFYAADVAKLQNQMEQALKEVREGRKYQPLHYRCLVAEFEILMQKKQFNEAHELIAILLKNFPLSPTRLKEVFIASVFSYNFSFLPEYYERFLKLEQRPPELVKVVSLAFFTAGKWSLGKDERASSIDYFEKALATVGREFVMVEKVVMEYVKAKAVNEAQQFLKRVLPDDLHKAGYNRLSFYVDYLTLRPDQLIDRGRKLVQAGEATPEIFTILVTLAAEQGKVTLAETFIQNALLLQPDLRDPLYKILESNAKPAS